MFYYYFCADDNQDNTSPEFCPQLSCNAATKTDTEQ